MKRKLKITLPYRCYLELTFLTREQMFREETLWISTQLMTLSLIITFNSSLFTQVAYIWCTTKKHLLSCWWFNLHFASEYAICKVKTQGGHVTILIKIEALGFSQFIKEAKSSALKYIARALWRLSFED